MKAIVTHRSEVTQNNTFEVTFDIYNGQNNTEIEVQNMVVTVSSLPEAAARIGEILEQRKAVKIEAESIPIGFEILLA